MGVQSSLAHERATAARLERISLACKTCDFHGACSGFFVGEATPEQRLLDDAGRLKCAIALPLHRYIEQKLATAGVIDFDEGTVIERSLPKVDLSRTVSEAIEY